MWRWSHAVALLAPYCVAEKRGNQRRNSAPPACVAGRLSRSDLKKTTHTHPRILVCVAKFRDWPRKKNKDNAFDWPARRTCPSFPWAARRQRNREKNLAETKKNRNAKPDWDSPPSYTPLDVLRAFISQPSLTSSPSIIYPVLSRRSTASAIILVSPRPASGSAFIKPTLASP
jgi:hypothetical protein